MTLISMHIEDQAKVALCSRSRTSKVTIVTAEQPEDASVIDVTYSAASACDVIEVASEHPPLQPSSREIVQAASLQASATISASDTCQACFVVDKVVHGQVF